MNRVAVAVGSNIDAERNVAMALEELSRQFKIVAQSQLVWTKPVYPDDQPHPATMPEFLNGVILIETNLEQTNLRDWLRALEDRLGRRRTGDKYAPRTIDLDVVVWNGQIVDEDVYRRQYLRQAVREVLPELGEQLKG